MSCMVVLSHKICETFMGLILVWFPRKSAILLSVCMSSPSALIYEPTGQLQSNIKKQKPQKKKNLKDLKFSQVSWASNSYSSLAIWTLCAQSKSVSPVWWVCPRIWGTSWGYCRYWGQSVLEMGFYYLHVSLEQQAALKQHRQLLKYD